jgi:hypothetical protein
MEQTMPKPVATATNKEKAPVEEGGIMYDKIHVEYCYGDDALDEEAVKDMLGYKEVDTDDYVGVCKEFKKLTGKNVIFTKNRCNRPIRMRGLKKLIQDHLNGHFTLNCENIIITDRGNVFSGQNRLISFLVACHERQGKNSAHWLAVRPEPFVMETLVAFGAPQTDEVFRTLNSGEPATLADVVSRSELLATFSDSDHKALSRITDFAVRYLWKRTNINKDSYTRERTNSEAMEFLDRHPKLMECIHHIWTESKKDTDTHGIKRVITLGNAAAMMYLMAASNTSYGAYYEEIPTASERSEDQVDLTMYDKAALFWKQVAEEKGAGPMKELRNAIDFVTTQPKNGVWGEGTLTLKTAVFCRAWALYAKGTKLTKENMTLRIHVDADKLHTLVDTFSFGGIDFTQPPTPEEPKGDSKRTDQRSKLLEMRNGTNTTKPGDAKPGTPKPESGPKPDKAPADDSRAEALLKLKAKHAGKILVFPNKEGGYTFWGQDAYTAARLLNTVVTKNESGPVSLRLTKEQFDKGVPKLLTEGTIALCKYLGNGKGISVKDFTPKAQGGGSKPAAPKPASGPTLPPPRDAAAQPKPAAPKPQGAPRPARKPPVPVQRK